MVTASPRRRPAFLRTWTVPGLALLLLASPAAASEAALAKKAQAAEKARDWGAACRLYDELSRKDRGNPDARLGYHRCLRRLQLTQRHADALYRQALSKLTTPQALDLYDQVLGVLTIAYPDRTRTALPQLFRQGLNEIGHALDDASFRKHYLPNARPKALDALKARLKGWDVKSLSSRADARAKALALLQEAPRDVGSLRAPAMCALILELAAGACASLDEHSSFLTPGHLAGMQAAVRGDVVGVGADVGLVKDRVQVTRVYPNGPAEKAGLKPGDVLLKIAGQKVKDLDADAVAKLLRGKSGQKVDVEVEKSDGSLEKVPLIRRAVEVTSVEFRRGGRAEGEDLRLLLPDSQVALGYIKIHHFQGSTTREVKEALANLTGGMDPVKGIILDLRGNPGGLFRAAISVAELFLSDAVIVVGQSPFPEYNKSFKSASTNPTQLPVVVLIDGDTASAAEVLAGAMKEVRRSPTRVMGQTSYGKGSIQCLIPLEKTALNAPAGIRLTVAKLLSPTSEAYTGRGVAPNEPSDAEGDKLVEKAVEKIGEMLTPSMGMGMATGMDGGMMPSDEEPR